MLCALCVGQASALEYTMEAPDDYLFGRPTSDDTIYEWEDPNVDRSKNTALIPPGFGTPTSYLPGSGDPLTPNLIPGALDGGGLVSQTGSVNYPVIDTGNGGSSGQDVGYTAVTSDLYYSGGHLGTLKIPAIGLSTKVYEGTDSSTLAKGAGHFPGTSIWDGNCCIAGHNRGVRDDFGDLHTLEPGDTITWTTKLGTRTYQVVSVEKVLETDTSDTASTTDNRITLLRRRIKVELLDALSISISACRGDFGTAGAVMFLLELGELLEEWTRKKSVEDLARCMALNVDRVWLRTSEGEVLIPISQVQPGDAVVVRAGGIIPVDGVVLEGEITVNQASLTGESIPVPKRPGGAVYAGTVVEEGECVLEVKKASGQSRYDQIVHMIEQSEQMKSAAESKAAHLADKLVPYTFAGSLLSFVLTRNVARALSVLMVDFSCALKLAMPLAVLSAMREAGDAHITVKGGKFLEAVAAADTIVFDKTGTLTHACPKVAKIIPFGGKDEREMLRVAACLEEHFPHSMANAVVEEARQQGLTHDEFHSKVEYLVAHGIASTVNGERVLIGSAHFVFEDEHCQIPECDQERFDMLPPEYSHLYLAVGG